MNRIRDIIFISTFGIMMLVSCAKDNSNPVNNNNINPPAFTPAMTTSINGGGWIAKSDSGLLSGSDNATVYGVRGISTIYLNLSSLKPASYTLSSGSQTSINYSPDGIGLFKSDSGTVVISSDSSNIIQGTFQGRLTNGHTGGYIYRFTNGKFIARLGY